MRRFGLIIGGLLLGLSAAPASAVCSAATLQSDYRQADVVVRALVVASMQIADDEPDTSFKAKWGGYSPISLDRLRVLEVFKGKPGPTVKLFEEVSSGMYGVELGREYLMFLTYYRPAPGSAAQGAMYVRHTCGQTEPWSKVGALKLEQLRAISRRHESQLSTHSSH
jgi:hypothetical protein